MTAMKSITLVFLTLYNFALLAQEKTFTDADTSISVSVGETFNIMVTSNRSTGYSWSVGEISDGAQVVIFGSEYTAPEAGMPGKAGYETWRFKALGSGNIKLVWNYIRPWEKGEASARTLTFNISVE
jgi:inhibitor of cysteine peptidase